MTKGRSRKNFRAIEQSKASSETPKHRHTKRGIERKALDRELFGTRKAALTAKAAAAEAPTPAAAEAIINAAIAARSAVAAAAAVAWNASQAASTATNTAGDLEQQDNITSQRQSQQSYDYNFKKLSIVSAEPTDKVVEAETSKNRAFVTLFQR